jgi:hypothetical protein
VSYEQHCVEIVSFILARVNEGKKVSFMEDRGEGSISIYVDGRHTHAGYPGDTQEELVQQTADLLSGRQGMSWA